MSIRLEMLQVARLAPRLLGDSKDLVAGFLKSQQNADGGWRDRDGRSDVYYSVFGLESLLALQEPFAAPKVVAYLERFAAGDNLDFVHFCCLLRCWSALGGIREYDHRPQAAARLAMHRTCDGGFSPLPGGERSTPYACFLSAAAYQDLSEPVPNPEGLAKALLASSLSDGSWANQPAALGTLGVSVGGSTLATAAAVTVLRQLGVKASAESGEWLSARAHPHGGFCAAPGAPMPDLLSTAIALHTLGLMGVDLAALHEPCLDFLDSLWTNQGAFHGHWADDLIDCEYTYYGLLALGALTE